MGRVGLFFFAAVALVAVAAFRPGTRNVLPSRVASSRRRASPPSSIPDFGTDAPFPQNVYVPPPASTPRTLLPTTFADMKEMAFILAQITEHLDTDPGKAMTVASQRMGWLYARNVPQLTQMLLTEFPAFRQDDGMMRAYLFVLDFLEAVVAETSALQTKNQTSKSATSFQRFNNDFRRPRRTPKLNSCRTFNQPPPKRCLRSLTKRTTTTPGSAF